VAVAVLLGLLAGSFPIANTSIGWHLASGHWILDNAAVPRTDPFSITAPDAPWIDHEWLFQVAVAVTETVAGPAGLVILRAALVAALAVLLLGFGLGSGLSPAAALLLTTLCLYGARIRFFLRPELVTLLIAPAVIWIFLHRDRWRTRRWLAAIAGLMVVGANFHGGALIAPVLVAGVLAFQWLQWLVTRRGSSPLAWGAAGLATATIAPVLNPYGWRLYTVPLQLAHLVGLPHIPNPEWISPSFGDYPPLYVAMAAGVAVLAIGERRAGRWALLLLAGALGFRYVRNVGLFFALYPVAVGAALATVPMLSASGAPARRWRWASLALSVAVVAAMISSPGRSPGFDFSDGYYPQRAWRFLDDQNLLNETAYNDVGFGGFLIHRHYPERRTFLDDRNEIHEPLLAEIHSILTGSDPAAWQAMLERYGVTLALLRYNPPFTVVRPDGTPVGQRGFSALWFPTDRWALIYWDDVAMVLADRGAIASKLVARHEYRVIRPDDTDELRRQLAARPELMPQFVAELERKIHDQPECQRALELAEILILPPS
jgi:hypothetical protein